MVHMDDLMIATKTLSTVLVSFCLVRRLMWFPQTKFLSERLLDMIKLDMIKRQNEDCITGDWTIKRGLARDKGNVKELWSIDPESRSHLLRKQNQLNMGMVSLKAFIPGGTDDKDVMSTGETESGAD
ncbi:hypothetical protein ACLKA6_013506 [Drosophila palustris]